MSHNEIGESSSYLESGLCNKRSRREKPVPTAKESGAVSPSPLGKAGTQEGRLRAPKKEGSTKPGSLSSLFHDFAFSVSENTFNSRREEESKYWVMEERFFTVLFFSPFPLPVAIYIVRSKLGSKR